jgi:cell wall-associated NlpC family hydrolase
MRNLRYGDRDSLGLFQQRPSQGWGTPDQILTPTYAATRFYQALVAMPNWQQLPLAEAADVVQRSAHPLAYADQEAKARQIYNTVTGAGASAAIGGVDQLLGNPGCLLGGGDGLPPDVASVLPAGFSLPVDTPLPVRTAIAWALGQLGTPYSYGGDCTDAHSGNPAHQCDCSSLVQQAYAHAGIALPRTTGDQVHGGAAVSGLAALKPGDLVFIAGADGTQARPGHVGLYIGDGLLVHAPHTGTAVQVARIRAWAARIVALRRIPV